MGLFDWFLPKPEPVAAAPAPSPEPVLPFCCPDCGSPHSVEVARVRHLYPGDYTNITRSEKGDVCACAICGTVYIVTNRGVEERKQRQPVPPPQGQPAPEGQPDLNTRMKELRWRRPKV